MRYFKLSELDFSKIEILQNLKEKEYSFTSAKGENFRYCLPCEWYDRDSNTWEMFGVEE